MIPGRVATPVPVWATILTRTSLKADGRAGRPPGRAASGRGPEAPGLGERAECCRAHTGSTPRSRSNAAIRLLGHLVPAAPKWRGDRAELRFGPNAVHRAPHRTASSQPLGAARVRPLELAGFSPADRRDRPGLALALPHRALGGGGWPRVPDAAARCSPQALRFQASTLSSHTCSLSPWQDPAAAAGHGAWSVLVARTPRPSGPAGMGRHSENLAARAVRRSEF